MVTDSEVTEVTHVKVFMLGQPLAMGAYAVVVTSLTWEGRWRDCEIQWRWWIRLVQVMWGFGGGRLMGWGAGGGGGTSLLIPPQIVRGPHWQFFLGVGSYHKMIYISTSYMYLSFP